MSIPEPYIRFKEKLRNKIILLDDKPNKTLASTLKALWMTACGMTNHWKYKAKRSISLYRKDRIEAMWS